METRCRTIALTLWERLQCESVSESRVVHVIYWPRAKSGDACESITRFWSEEAMLDIFEVWQRNVVSRSHSQYPKFSSLLREHRSRGILFENMRSLSLS